MSEVAKPQSFQERMSERIKDSIADLMTDEELKPLVEKAVQQAFFEPQKSQRGYHTYMEPSWFEETVKGLLQDSVTAEVQKQIVAKSDEITAMIEKVIKEGVGAAMLQSISSMFSNDFYNFANNIQNQIDQMRNG